MNIVSANEVKNVFETNTGMRIREESLSEYLKSDKYLDDISLISYLLSDKSSDVDISAYSEMIATNVEDIIKIYSEVFESSFEAERAIGVIDDHNFYTIKNGQLNIQPVIGDNGAAMGSVHKYVLCNLTKQLGYKGSASFVYDAEEINKGVVYFPLLILRFVMGCSNPNPSNLTSYITHPEYGSSWGNYSKKVIRPYLTKILEENVKACVSNNLDMFKILDIMHYHADILKTCCVVLQYSESIAISIKGYLTGMSIDDLNSQVDTAGARISSQDVSLKVEENGVFSVKFIRDKKKYSLLPLFAYQALDAARANNRLPAWNDLIIGRYAKNDKMFRANFESGDLKSRTVAHVVAGSRAGKGVMCLNILASVLGSGLPVFYADCKPDMSETLKKVCGRTVLVDATSDKIIPDVWSKLRNTEAYGLFGDFYYLYGGLIYLRLIQLSLAIAEVRMYITKNGDIPSITREELGWNRSKGNGGGWDELVVFLDEFEKAMGNVVTALSIFNPKEYKIFELKAKDQLEIFEQTGNIRKYAENAPSYINFGSKLESWVNDIGLAVGLASKASMAMGKVRYFLIYQSYVSDMSDQCAVFKAFKDIDTKMCFIGNNTNFFSDTSLGMNMFNEMGYLQNRLRESCFVFTVDSPTTLRAMNRAKACVEAGTTTVFKSYLLLNDSDIKGDCANEFFGRIPKEFVPEFAVTDSDGNPIAWKDNRVGFKDYIDCMLSLQNNGTSVESVLSVGKDIADRVVKVIGYNDYVDFITDLSASSMVRTADLVDAIVKGTNIKQASVVINQNVGNINIGKVDFVDSDAVVPYSSSPIKSQSTSAEVESTRPTPSPNRDSRFNAREQYYQRQRTMNTQPIPQPFKPTKDEIISKLWSYWEIISKQTPQLKSYYTTERLTDIINKVADMYIESIQ